MAASVATMSPRPLHVIALALAVLLTLLAGALAPAWFEALNERSGDSIWRRSARTQQEQRVIIVDIDEASLGEFGPWPWPRQRLTELSDKIAALGAGLQVFDLVLNDAHPEDAALAAALLRRPTVLAEVFAVEQGAGVRSGQLDGATRPSFCSKETPGAGPFPAAHGYIAPAAAFAGLPVGHITPRINQDGIVRKQAALICQDDNSYPALALAAYLTGAGISPPLELKPGLGWKDARWRLGATGMGRGIPLDAEGNLRIPYGLANDALISIPAADVLAGRVPQGLPKGAWVLVGSTAFGLGDVVATPHGGAQGGVSVHAQLLTGLLDEQLPFTPQGENALRWLPAGALLILLLFAARWRRLPGYTLPLLGIVLAAGLLATQAYWLLAQQWWVGMAQPALAVLLAGLFLGLAEFARTGGERERLFAHLASYLPPPVASRLLALAPQSQVEAERREVTVLFADIRNFSAYCEAHQAEDAARLLHRFIETASRVVEARGGLIEAVQGDAIMAVWNGSSSCADHAAQALAAAREMHGLVESQFPALDATELAEGRLAPLALGIGMESGLALVGSFGPRSRRVHTALGEPVTVAVRLQALTANLAWPILIGPGCAALIRAQLPNAQLLPQGEFLLEGLIHPRTVYALPKPD